MLPYRLPCCLPAFLTSFLTSFPQGDVKRLDAPNERELTGIAVQDHKTGTVYYIDYLQQTEYARSPD